ncbi:MAG: hypothetical protein BGO43_09705 [Gammaproteobacteria bacterium 39-13]|nr:DUF1365 domain-containing protein [Gammaproteobacteria bacterium]OJV93914.1 MAG: hypothetical protein BGO43_09705 [Gammaproteobacteria bacterium 39-13]
MSEHKLFEGFVRHRRLEPKLHEFCYPIFQFYIDLDNISELTSISPLLSIEKFNYITFYRKNYFRYPEGDLKKSLLEYVGIQNNHCDYKAYLLTNLSFAGYCFNPISLYFIYKNQDLTAMVAEVTNTPWHDRHLYVLDNPIKYAPPMYQFNAKKKLHVSPFMSMNYNYEFNLKLNNEEIILYIRNLQDGKETFNATLNMKSKSLTKKNLHCILRQYPFLTHKITTLIHWHALKLWFKGMPFHPHPKKNK